jgi:alpha-N-arabinofuranosidase
MLKIAVGPGVAETSWTEADDEGLAASRLDLEHRRSFASLVYNADRMAAGRCLRPASAVEDYDKTLKSTLFMDEFLRKQEAVMDQYDPQKKVALVVDEWGAWLKLRCPAPTRVSWCSRTACGTRSWPR